ncbi:MgtC/SapB family protein [Mangrovimonas xylaniphaga]|uniref:MgtC/SapB family protein n=1 Tax=Mangrovimonas xylaniphaga TaxID=1645915 RepID=UPI0006B680D2|nr:MgtC/SapB family protein [Mangrovimonas xylaniphaga]
MNYDQLTTLGIAFGLGLLVGVQRQKSDNKMAGVRTFTLLSVLGVMAAYLTQVYDNPYILPALGLSIAAMFVTANMIKYKSDESQDFGQTTEVAALLMFSIGAYLVLGDQLVGVIVGTLMAILLYVKERLHHFIDRLSEKDLSAIMTLAGISLVILPILPDKTFGPYGVLNPRNIWLMITLIVGISVVGYFIYKFAGKRVGVIANGILGGLISSTATTVSYARKTKSTSDINKMAAFVIATASMVSLVRVLIEITVVVPQKLNYILLPILAEIIVLALLCASLFYLVNKDETDDEMPEPENPAQFKSALLFGLLYALILLAVAFTEEKFGNEALYLVSIVSGLTDVDAITLSISQLMKIDNISVHLGWKLILLAALSNLVFKGIMAMMLGTKQLAKWVGVVFGVALVVGLFIIWLWPDWWHL